MTQAIELGDSRLLEVAVDDDWPGDPGPPPYPGPNYEQVRRLPGFIDPESAIRILNQRIDGLGEWVVEPRCAPYPFQLKYEPWKIVAGEVNNQTPSDHRTMIGYELRLEYLIAEDSSHGRFDEVSISAGRFHNLVDILATIAPCLNDRWQHDLLDGGIPRLLNEAHPRYELAAVNGVRVIQTHGAVPSRYLTAT